MIQREVTDHDGTQWSCVQAFSGTEGKLAERAQELSENGNKVPVVCTPSGGAQSVRLELVKEWEENMEDKEIVSAIAAAQK